LKDYYEILGIHSYADTSTIKKAYFALVKKYHPDSRKSRQVDNAREKFESVKEAYDTLINDELRKKYDKYMLRGGLRKRKAKDEHHKNIAIAHYRQGRKFYRIKRYHSAVRSFQTALALERHNALYCTWLGLALSHIPGRLRDAKRWCEEAIRLSPFHADFYINLALIYQDAGEASRAMKNFKKAIEIDPDNRRAHSWLQKKSDKPSLKKFVKGIVTRKKR
jgi:curved DNA-binding protein CbpA